MIIKKNHIRCTDRNLDIYGDKSLFRKIVKDMLKNADQLRPEPNWDLERGGKNGGDYFHETVLGGKTSEILEYEFNDDHYDQHFSSLQQMMEPWIGCTGESMPKPDTVKQYIHYLHEIDHLNLLEQHFDLEGNLVEGQKPLMTTDLGSIMDINLITSQMMDKDILYIVEVGGGYGRLAEAFMHMFGPEQIRYVLIDAVPASLMYAHLYMKDRFPEANIGSYYHGEKFDLEQFQCYVIPAWHFDEANTYDYDVSVNVQSMQEMGQFHVNHYLSSFESITSEGGMIYLSNEKDYVFRGTWNYPANWNCIFKQRTPRSWTRNSPTEIFIKNKGDFTSRNRLMDFIYLKQLQDSDNLAASSSQSQPETSLKLDAIQNSLDDISNEVKNMNESILKKLIRKAVR